MKYIYHCKHCHTVIDVIEGNEDIGRQLGLADLTMEEKEDFLTFDKQEQKVYVKTVCDYCYQAIVNNPELAIIGNPLQ